MNQGLPFSPQQADYSFYRQDPNVSQEVMLQIPDFPARLAGQRDALERFARVVLQNGHQRNPLRLFVYNQMSANNWQNLDWIALVKNLGNLLDFLIFDQHNAGTQELVSGAVELTVKLMMLRAVEQYPNLQSYLDQAMYNELGQIKQRRDQIRTLMSQTQVQQGGLFPQQNQMNQNAQLMNVGGSANWSAGLQQQFHQQPQAQQTQLGGGTSSRISIGDLAPPKQTQPTSIQTGSGMFETWESDPNRQHANIGGGNTNFRGFFAETEEVQLKPNWEQAAPAPAPEQPVETNYRDELIAKYGAVFPMIEIAGKAYPLVYDRYRFQINENGALMKIEDHVIEQMEAEPRPVSLSIPHYVPVDKTAPESAVNTRVSFLKAAEEDHGLEVLPDAIVGLEIDTAAGLVNMRTNAYIEKKVVEFTALTVDAVFVPDVEKFKADFAGLLIESPESDITKLMELVKSSGQVADALYRKLNRRVTTAINQILNENLGLSATISDGATDWAELPAWLNKKKGAKHLAALSDSVMAVVNAACCIASGELDDTVRDYNYAKLHINQTSGVIYDRKLYDVRSMDSAEMEAYDSEVLASCSAAALTIDSFIQLIYRDYVSLLPVEFENLGIDIADGKEVTVVHESAHPELNNYIKGLYRRAGGDVSRFDNIYLTTIDGAVMRVVRLSLADDTVLGLVRVF